MANSRAPVVVVPGIVFLPDIEGAHGHVVTAVADGWALVFNWTDFANYCFINISNIVYYEDCVLHNDRCTTKRVYYCS